MAEQTSSLSDSGSTKPTSQKISVPVHTILSETEKKKWDRGKPTLLQLTVYHDIEGLKLEELDETWLAKPVFPAISTLAIFADLTYEDNLHDIFPSSGRNQELPSYEKKLRKSFKSSNKDVNQSIVENYIEIRIKSLKEMKKEWQLLVTAYNDTDHYFGAAFWNSTEQQLVFSHRGTDPKDPKVILADIEGVMRNWHTLQIDSACTFVAHVLQEFSYLERFKQIQISITGHSLGAWLAQITTFSAEYFTVDREINKFRFTNEGLYHVHTVGFESPGCREMLIKIWEMYKHRYEFPDYLSWSNLDITVCLTRPNLINECGKHVGKLIQIDITPFKGKAKSFFAWFLSRWELFKILDGKYTSHYHSRKNIVTALMSVTAVEVIHDWPLLAFPKKATNDPPVPPKSKMVAAVKVILNIPSLICDWYKTDKQEASEFQKRAQDEGTDSPKPDEDIAGGINNHYKTDEERQICHLNTFSKVERFFLSYWQKVNDLNLGNNLKDEIEKTCLKLNLSLKLDHFKVPFSDLSHDEKFYMEMGSQKMKFKNEFDVDKLVSFVKQLFRFFDNSEKFVESFAQNTEAIVLICRELSQSYLKRINVNCFTFTDNINLRTSLNFNEQKLIFIKSKFKFEIQRIRNILCTEKDKQFIFLDLNQIADLKYMNLPLIKKQNQTTFKSMKDIVIVLDCQQQESLDEKDLKRLTILLENIKMLKSIVIVSRSESFKNSLEHIREIDFKFEVNSQNFNVRDLTSASQKAFINLLTKTEIFLQGKSIKLFDVNMLNDFDSNIVFKMFEDLDSEIVSKLIEEGELRIGSEPMRFCESEAAYAKITFPLSIDTNTLIKALKDEHKKELFIFTGNVQDNTVNFMEKLGKLLNTESDEVDKHKILDADTLNLRDKIKILTSTNKENNEEIFRNCCYNNSDLKVYWLEVIDVQFRLLQVYDTNFYESRKFLHHAAGTNFLDFFRNNKLVFSGTTTKDINEKLALCLKNQAEIDLEKENVKVFASFDEDKARKTFDEWCLAFQTSPVHWFKVENNHFILHKSRSSSNEPRNYEEKSDETVFADLNRDVVILTAEPGMGKSTVLTRLSQYMLGKRWVIRLNLKDHKKELLNLPENKAPQLNIDSFVRFLLKVSSPPNESCALTAKLLRCSLLNEVPLPLLILFDGYDEIDNVCQIKVMTLMKFLKKHTRAKFWITSRKHYTLELEMNLRVHSTTFKELEEVERRKFLKHFWQVRLELGLGQEQEVFRDNESSKFRLFSDALFVEVKKVIDDKISKFMGIPLQMRLLAEYFLSEFHNHVTSEPQPLVPNFEGISLTRIYQSFIDKKFDIYFKEKTKLSVAMNDVLKKQFSESWLKIHQKLALYLLFPNEAKYLLEIQSPFSEKNFSIDSDVERELKLIGMVQAKAHGGEIEFIHRTFAEYFAATLILNWLRKPIRTKKLDAIESLLKCIFQKFEVICFFINEQISISDVALPKAESFSETMFESLYEMRELNYVNLIQFIVSFFTNKKWLVNRCKFNSYLIDIIGSSEHSKIAACYLKLMINNYDVICQTILGKSYDVDLKTGIYKFRTNVGAIYERYKKEPIKNLICTSKWHSKIMEEFVKALSFKDLRELCEGEKELYQFMRHLKQEDSFLKENEINRLMNSISDKYQEDFFSNEVYSFMKRCGDGKFESDMYYLERFISLIGQSKPREVIIDFPDLRDILKNIELIAARLNDKSQIGMYDHLPARNDDEQVHEIAEIIENEKKVCKFLQHFKNDEDFTQLLELLKDFINKEKVVEEKITFSNNDDDAVEVINGIRVDNPKVFLCLKYYEDHLRSSLHELLKAKDQIKFVFYGLQNESQPFNFVVPSSITERIESFLRRLQCDETKHLLFLYLSILAMVDFISKDNAIITELINILLIQMNDKKITTLRDVFDCIEQYSKVKGFAEVETEPKLIDVEMLMEVLQFLFVHKDKTFSGIIENKDILYLERMLNCSKDFPGIFCLIIFKAFETRRCTMYGNLAEDKICFIFKFVHKYFSDLARCLAMGLFPFDTTHISNAIQLDYRKVISLSFKILKPYPSILQNLTLGSIASHKCLLNFVILQSDMNTLELFLTELNRNANVMQYVIEISVPDEEDKLNLYEAAVIKKADFLLIFLNSLKFNDDIFKSFILPADVKPAFYLAGERGCKEVIDTLLSALKSEPDILWELLTWTDPDSGQTVLHRACDKGYTEIVYALLHSIRKQPEKLKMLFLFKDKSQNIALDCAILSERQIIRNNFTADMRKKLIDNYDYKTLKTDLDDFDEYCIDSPIDSLHTLSCNLKNMPMVVNLLLIIAKSFNNVEIMLAIFENEDLKSALKDMHITLDTYSYHLFDCSIERNSLELVQQLIDMGIEVNTPNGYGFTPLMRAVCANKLDIAKLLIDSGADIYAKDMNHKSAISYARDVKLYSEMSKRFFN